MLMKVTWKFIQISRFFLFLENACFFDRFIVFSTGYHNFINYTTFMKTVSPTLHGYALYKQFLRVSANLLLYSTLLFTSVLDIHEKVKSCGSSLYLGRKLSLTLLRCMADN